MEIGANSDQQGPLVTFHCMPCMSCSCSPFSNPLQPPDPPCEHKVSSFIHLALRQNKDIAVQLSSTNILVSSLDLSAQYNEKIWAFLGRICIRFPMHSRTINSLEAVWEPGSPEPYLPEADRLVCTTTQWSAPDGETTKCARKSYCLRYDFLHSAAHIAEVASHRKKYQLNAPCGELKSFRLSTHIFCFLQRQKMFLMWKTCEIVKCLRPITCSKGPRMTHRPRDPGAFPYICGPRGGQATTTRPRSHEKNSFLSRRLKQLKSMLSATFHLGQSLTSSCPSLPWPPCPNIPYLQGLVSRARIELETKCCLQDAWGKNFGHA